MSQFAYCLIISGGNLLFALGGYLIWPSRRNIPAHLNLSFAITAYLLPLFDAEAFLGVSPIVLQKYAVIQLIASPCYLLGLVIGPIPRWRLGVQLEQRIRAVPEDWLCASMYRKAQIAIVLGTIAIVASYMVQGFVPLFAQNPLEAKFGRGEYQASYQRVAIPFRLGLFTLMYIVPMGIVLGLTMRRGALRILGLTGCGVAALFASLAKAYAGQGVLVGLLLAATRLRRGWFWPCFAILMLAVPLGCLIPICLDAIMGGNGFAGHYQTGSVASRIVSGTPDIPDHLHFLDMFEAKRRWTYGRTFLGGLVPFQYQWNPSVWTLAVLDRGYTDVSKTVSGGLRLPVSIWGYTAFGYLGAAIIPFFSGLVRGAFTGFCARNVNGQSLVRDTLFITVFLTIGEELAQFYLISLYWIPGTAITIWLLMLPRLRTTSARGFASRLTMSSGPRRLSHSARGVNRSI